MSEFVNFYLIPGSILGSVYALGAIGITLTFGILRFANFAHGEMMTLGVYFAWSLVRGPAAGRNPFAAKGLEWQTSSPPIPHNFETQPVVTEEAYNYAGETAAEEASPA